MISPKAAEVLRRPSGQRAFVWLTILFLSIAGLNQIADFYENYNVGRFTDSVYSIMSEIIVERGGADEYQIKQKEGYEKPTKP
ncbi:hypothetical protein, partial [Stenotrophomonas sp. GbtcB23]|uniref:hypothetical protein n=1 Tax=Stenotrophomonas sp. GbtcB23 TaxID=2824768 RepID=UPI001C2FA6A1